MPLKPSDTYYGEFTTCRFDTGAATDADSLPVATATKNGVDDSAFVLTVTKIDTGRYKITGTVPSGYAGGNQVQVSVSATVSSVAGKAVVDSFVIDPKRVGDLHDVQATDIVTNGAIATSGGAVSSVTTAANLTNAPANGDFTAAMKASITSAVPSANANAVALADLNYVGHQTGSTFGAAWVTTMNDSVSIKAKTDNLPSDPASASAIDTSFATVNTMLDALSNGPSAVEIRQELDTNSTRLAYLTGDAFARLGAPVGASISADIQTRSVYAGEAVAGVTSPVTLTSAYDAAKFAAKPGDKMTLDLTQKLSAPRALDSVADTDLTVNDMMHCAIADAAGKAAEDVTALTYTVRTPYTGTVLRTFTVDSVTNPTIRS